MLRIFSIRRVFIIPKIWHDIFFLSLFYFEGERECKQGRGREKERQRENPKQASCCQQGA